MGNRKITFHIITIFPEFYASPLSSGLFKKAIEKNVIGFKFIDLKEFGIGKHKQIDDTPYGGGVGMVLRPEPIVSAINSVKPEGEKKVVVLMSPSGDLLTQKKAKYFAEFSDIVVVCPRYEGVDERVKKYVDWEISIGDFVIHSGDTACLVFVEAVSRLVEGFMTSRVEEEITFNLLGFPHYTRPREFENQKVPDELVSGHHEKIRMWRIENAVRKTIEKRPDLVLKNLLCIYGREIPSEKLAFLIDELFKFWISELECEKPAEKIEEKKNINSEKIKSEIFYLLVKYFSSKKFEHDPFLPMP